MWPWVSLLTRQAPLHASKYVHFLAQAAYQRQWHQVLTHGVYSITITRE